MTTREVTAHARLRAAYLRSGLTVDVIADRVGCSKNTLLRLVGPSPRNVRADVLLAAADVLRVPLGATSCADE